jgi:hypothetical protein
LQSSGSSSSSSSSTAWHKDCTFTGVHTHNAATQQHSLCHRLLHTAKSFNSSPGQAATSTAATSARQQALQTTLQPTCIKTNHVQGMQEQEEEKGKAGRRIS